MRRGGERVGHGSRRPGLSYAEVAYLRGGRQRVVQAVVVALYLKGAVEPGRPGTVASTESQDSDDPVEHAICHALYDFAAPRVLAERPPVRHAMADLRRLMVSSGFRRPQRVVVLIRAVAVGLVGAGVAGVAAHKAVVLSGSVVGVGLLFAVSAHRTWRAHRALRAVRSHYRVEAWSRRSSRVPDETVTMAVALHGDRALRALAPRFAHDAGLLTRKTATDVVADSTLDRPNRDAIQGGLGPFS